MPEDFKKVVIRHKREGDTRVVVLAVRRLGLAPAIGSAVTEIWTMLLGEVEHVHLIVVSWGTTW